ncbi:transcriptional regulator, TetR family [Tenacibaculum sp. MAR_2009_124]|uniref:TetR/AcrR family transcriptional regulator n=1 Tax=Tenacibaculum sp. MAR_2009_124 TaxID=1250059 RepID=UPI000896D015|nr:TetR/AcrR family transcriptional regulator [Tenacibaculum sp. MAR_2009_124]SEB38334.1 transcriptional regulator, TetR family [Tenacibaculum sp. MAR_2009_124]
MPKTETFNKEQVINQAREVFHSKSYNATSMQDLVDATGLNRSSIYNSFGSKHELYLACLKSYQSDSRCKIESIIHADTCSLKVLENIFSMNMNNSKGCLINNCTSEMANQDDIIRKFLTNNQKGMTGLFQQIVQLGQEQGAINSNKSAREYALYLLATFQGLSMANILENDRKEIESIITTTLSVLT